MEEKKQNKIITTPRKIKKENKNARLKWNIKIKKLN